MKWIFAFVFFQLKMYASDAQTLTATLNRALQALEDDQQFLHSSVAMYVKDLSSGKIIVQKNAQLGLAAASCQKVITSATGFALLGRNFHFVTLEATDGIIRDGHIDGNLIVKGGGDPSLGSWRWPGTTQLSICNNIRKSLQSRGVQSIRGSLIVDDSKYRSQPVPDGWIWQDIGNYYGAGCWSLNWHENQYDLHLRSSPSPGELTTVLKTSPFDFASRINNSIMSGAPGSGDNAYLYAAPFSETIFATGTIPAGENDFIISGSVPDPVAAFSKDLTQYLNTNNVAISAASKSLHGEELRPTKPKLIIIDSILSPVFDSLNYWFLKKSVNLYGEAFVKEIGYQKNKEGSTPSGVNAIRDFWQPVGVSSGELNLMDGSGLSPANRVTCHALVAVMEYARSQTWFDSFYNSLPEMNGIKMKDGYINGVRSYTGFIKSRSGNTYCFAFIVNNFSGNPASVRAKMWKVLDLLK